MDSFKYLLIWQSLVINYFPFVKAICEYVTYIIASECPTSLSPKSVGIEIIRNITER